MEETRKKKVAFYIRVSTEEQAQDDKFGKKNQLESLHSLIRSKNATLEFAGEDYIYEDDISGTSDIEERPSFRKLMEDIQYCDPDNRPFDVVAVFKIDRFARRLKVLLNIIDWFEDYQLEFLSVHESIDTSTPFGKAMLGIIGVISELEIENIKLRTHGGRASAAKEGVFLSRIAPYGYTKNPSKQLIVLPSEAKTVHDIFDKFTWESYSPQKIADWLKDQNVPSPESSALINAKLKLKNPNKKYDINFWQVNTVKRMLGDEVYIGNYYYYKTKQIKGKQTDLPKSDWKLSEHHHEPIIDQFQFLKAQEILEDNRKNNTQYGSNREYIYLLSGLMKCTCCFDPNIDEYPQSWIGERKHIGKTTKNYTYMYRCRRRNAKKGTINCNSIPLPAKEIENYVINFIKELLSNPTDTFNYYKKLESSRSQKKQLERKLKSVNNLIEKYKNTRAILLEQNKRGILSINELEKEIKQLESNHKRNLEEAESLQNALNTFSISEGYNKVFEIFKAKYYSNLSEILKDRNQTQELIRLLIKEIVVSTRKVTKDDVLAGRKKENQEIPNKLLIKLRLPREILLDIIKKSDSLVKSLNNTSPESPVRFGANEDEWCQGADLNCRHLALQASALPAELP